MSIHPGQRLKSQLRFELGHKFYLTENCKTLFYEFDDGACFKALSNIHLLARAAGYDMLVVPFDDDSIRVHLEQKA